MSTITLTSLMRQAVAGCLCALAACTHTPDSGAGVPTALRAPSGLVVTVAAHGSGVQVYACQAAAEPAAGFSWILVAPEADLAYVLSGKKFGKHSAGPTWEANDGSRVVGNPVARDNGPDGSAIPWLLLTARSTGGNGIFSGVQSIQRVHTVGGKAPAAGCDESHAGQEVRIPYTADYYFYAPKG